MNKKFFALFGTLLLISIFTVTAKAQTATVGKTTDSNNPLPCSNCSLREAINTINQNGFGGQNNIFFNIAQNDPNCTGSGSTQICRITIGSELVISASGPLVIHGLGPDRLTIHMGGTDRIFRSSSPLTLLGMVLEFGQARGSLGGANGKGSAIYFNGFNGPLKLDSVIIQNNDGTAISGSAGAVYYSGGTGHTIFNSSFTGNSSGNCGAFDAESASVSVLNSTISNNTALTFGGGVCVNGGTTKFRSTTIAGNSAGNGGGGIFFQNGTLNLGNTIVAGNTGGNPLPGTFPDIRYFGGTLETAGGNLIGINTSVATTFPVGISPNPYFDRSGDAATPLNPQLAPLGTYGGKTLVRALNNTSPAIDHSVNLFGESPNLDQRGGVRDNFGDIGSFEYNAAYVGALPIAITFQIYNVVIAQNDNGFTYCVSSGTLPPGLSGIGICSADLGKRYLMTAPQAQVAISGTPTTAGTYPFTITATSPSFTTATDFQIVVSGSSTPTATPTASPTNTSTNTPTATPTATSTSTPTATPFISGTVTYANAIGTPIPRFVSNVTITGAGSPTVFTTTAAPGATAGQYILTGFGAGSYTVTPSKSSGANGISSFDAALIALHVAGPPNPQLNATQLIVADVSGNNQVTSFDAAMIAKFVIGPPYISPGIGLTAQWLFNPVNRNYGSVGAIPGQDFSAYLMGEVSGNWNNTGARQAGSRQLAVGGGPEKVIAVELPALAGSVEKEIVVSVNVNGVANKGVISYEFDLRYDQNVIQPLAKPVDVKGTSSRGLTAVVNGTEPGLLRVVVYGAMPIESDGVLLNLRFAAVGAAGSVSTLSFERMMFNEGEPSVNTADGKVELF